MASSSASKDNDDAVRQCILSTLASVPDPWIRPNKLRKLVCKKKNINWTQFQTALDALIQEKVILTKTANGGEIQIITNNGDDDDFNNTEKRETKQEQHEEVMKIPTAVAHHLLRKGGKKKQNIETNTKTKLKIGPIRNNTDATTITTELSILCSGDANDEKTKNRMKFAMATILKMIKAYEEHPDHFIHSKGGGTLEEQQKLRELKRKRREQIEKQAAGEKRRKTRKYF